MRFFNRDTAEHHIFLVTKNKKLICSVSPLRICFMACFIVAAWSNWAHPVTMETSWANISVCLELLTIGASELIWSYFENAVFSLVLAVPAKYSISIGDHVISNLLGIVSTFPRLGVPRVTSQQRHLY